MTDQFQYDVFLSHSSQDKDIVRPLAERLRADGLRVWFDEWILKPGDSIPAKIDAGLEQSRVLVLCMSANAFGSDWAQLESYTFRFRDPLNQERRFVPLRLDEAEIKGSLAQFLYINWLPEAEKQEYVKLFKACQSPLESPTATAEACGPITHKISQLDFGREIYAFAFSPHGKRVLTAGDDYSVRLWEVETGHCLRVLDGHTDNVKNVQWDADQYRALSCSWDKTVRLWNVETGRCLTVFEGHTNHVIGIGWSAEQHHVLSASWDNTLRLWDVETGHCLREYEGHTNSVEVVVWGTNQRQAISGSTDKTLRLWDIMTGRCLRVFEGHASGVTSVAWGNDHHRLLSGSSDHTVRLWDVETGHCLRILEGHTNKITSVAWNTDQRHAISSSEDKTLRLWDVETGRCLRVLEGHDRGVITAVWGADQRRVFSGDFLGGIIVWDLSEILARQRESKDRVPNLAVMLSQRQYTNAKVLLVGDSGVGKTGLHNRLTQVQFVETSSTDGAWATQWQLPLHTSKDGVEREIWLWDFAGQVDYRLVHQLFMNDTSAAVLVFNPQNENPFEGLGQWDRDLQKASRNPFAKLLVAGRVDRGGLVVSQDSIDKFISERGYQSPVHLTSAKTGEGCEALRSAIICAIDWQSIPEITSPALYHRLKQEILNLRDKGLVLIRLGELKQRMEQVLLGEQFELAELQTVIGLLAGPGMIQRVDFGGFILLRPEVLSRYAAAVVRRVRKHPQELGCISEDELLAGALDYQDFERLPADDEAVVLRTLHETFVSRAWCLRQSVESKVLLTFPSYFRRERPTQPGHPNVLVTYRFSGHIEDLYATLVVRLHHTEAFDADQLWKDAADFKTQTGQSLGLKLTREAEGAARLEVYFNPNVDENSRVVFLRYVHNHLSEHAQDVMRLRHYCCGNKKCRAFNQPFAPQSMIDEALAPSGSGKVFCPGCGKAIQLRDVMEQKFDSPAVKEEVRKEQLISQTKIDNESRELILVGHTFSITAEAGQIFRPTPNSDHGIDGEIEFKDDEGRATGRRLYLQLKSGDSYLKKRQRDEAEVFYVSKEHERWLAYWQQQAYPVMLVIRTSDGEIRWMDVSDYLRRAQQTVKQIVFAGERFEVMSVRRWRDRVLR
jgi:small GTP-binding protein